MGSSQTPGALSGREIDIQELIVIRSHVTGTRLTWTGVLRQARLVGAETVARGPFRRHLRAHPGGRHVAELIERIMHGFEDTCQPVPRANRRQDMRGIGALRAPRLHPPPRVAGGQEGVEAPWPALWSSTRPRQSCSNVTLKPGSVQSRPRAYVQSISGGRHRPPGGR